MPNLESRASSRWPTRRNIFLIALVLLGTGLTFFALALPLYASLSAPEFRVGDVSPQDVVAPRALEYISEISTSRQREAAAQAILPIYTSPDTSVARRQLERLRATLAYITSVRADAFASPEQKMADLAALEDIHIAQDTARRILALSDSRWQAVQQEAIVALEQVMRSTIREDRVEEARRSVPALVSLALPEDQAEIVAELVAGFVAPNSLYSEELTEAARQAAREAVAPVSRTYVAGELIVQRGQVLTPQMMEALEQLGLAQTGNLWLNLISAASLTVLSLLFVVLFVRRSPLRYDLRGLTIIISLLMIFLFGGRLIIPGHAIIPYIFPFAAFSLIVASLYGTDTAMFFTLPLAILISYNLPNSLDLTLFYLLSGIFGVFTLGAARRVMSFFWAGAAIAFAGVAVILAFRLPNPSTDLVGVLTLVGVAVVNGVASSSLTILLQYFLAQFLGLTTPLQLMEISRPDHPLLQFILRNAPGTYQHSLQVANLSEQAAEQVGADTLLTRVGALYHDAGKALNPFYFIENQVPNSANLHEDLEPATSAKIIIQHVPDGLDLADKYRLPRRVKDFIAEHHGTMITLYQYYQAVEAAGGDENLVDEEEFRYPGPKPQSRETAILMLADSSEASVRAERPKDEEELRALIKKVIGNRLANDQLDETELTLNDLDKIVESFTTTLRGTYHPRIEYPKFDRIQAGKGDHSPTLPVVRQASDVPVEQDIKP
jgi:cyclic-di-AMP phosphodiesterase PgpH